MKFTQAIPSAVLLLAVAACNQPSGSVPPIAQDADYFAAHLQEAKDVALKCRSTKFAPGSDDAQRCEAADEGLRRGIGAKVQKENFGDPKSLPEFGNGY